MTQTQAHTDSLRGDAMLEQVRGDIKALAIRTEKVDGKVDQLTALLTRNVEFERERSDNAAARLFRIEDKYASEISGEIRSLRIEVERRVTDLRKEMDDRAAVMSAAISSGSLRIALVTGGIMALAFFADRIMPGVAG